MKMGEKRPLPINVVFHFDGLCQNMSNYKKNIFLDEPRVRTKNIFNFLYGCIKAPLSQVT